MATLLEKLQLKPGQHLVVQNPPPGYLEKLTPELAGLEVLTHFAGPAQAVLLFVNTLDEAVRLAMGAFAVIHPDGLAWIAYPKGGSGVKTDLNRDRLWEALKGTGWRPVRQVALDEVWSAMRYRPAEKVGK